MDRRSFCKVLGFAAGSTLLPGLMVQAAGQSSVGHAVPDGRYTIGIRSDLSGCDLTHAFYYSDSFFAHPATQYDHQLALATLGLVCAAANTIASDAEYWVNGSVGREAHIAAAYETLGFEDALFYNYDLDTGRAGDFVGYSLARKVCIEGRTEEELREAREDLGGQSILEALLAPTRIYVKPVRAVMEQVPGGIRALAHITGGGITENLNRALPAGVNAEVDLGTWPIPSVVRFACEQANLSEAEALKTFNMGLGMVLIVDPAAAEAVEAALAAAGEETYRVGRIVAGEGEVQYANEGELF